jgi:deoxyribose-phosphate aldolase
MALDNGILDALTPQSIAPYIQHTLIETGLTRDRITRHAEEAVTHGFNAAMVPGSWVPEVAAVLEGTGVILASALDFPSCGVMSSRGKAAEAQSLVDLGAQQIDIGVQVGWLKSGLYDRFRDDIAGVVAVGVPVKVMLELPLLTPEERDAAVELAMEAGAAYLKNASSGAVEVANPQSIAYLASKVRDGIQVKASGSIKSYAQAASLLRAGAVLLGTSAGTSIIAGGEAASESY